MVIIFSSRCRYKNKDQLVRHVQTHEKPDIECELCHRVFGRPDHLKRHIATKHATERTYLSDLASKKKQNRKHQSTLSSEVNLQNVLHLTPNKIDRPGSEVSTLSVAEISSMQPVLSNQFDLN